ncbi:hypothetical protein ERJ75_001463200 [Trypanosoma vivax]|nr:hypothetical protein ERJ75_001463200 [Trypanosoma vivax]
MHILEWSRAKLHNDGGGHEGGEGRAVGEADAVAVALHNIFTHSHVRSALAQACSVSLDPENLLHRLLVYVSGWTADAEEVVASSPTLNVPGPAVNVSTEDWKVRCGTRLAQLQPNDVVFILDIVAAVLAGISFTSISATAILERAAELELTLSTFLVNRLYETFFKGNDDKDANTPLSASKGHRKINSIKRPLFAVSDSSVRLKTRRHLMLYTLHAIYQARALVFCCLQDLGIANVEAYLQMLEDTMWQLRGQVGAVVGSLTIDQLDATMGRNTRMPHAPFTHRLLLMPRMALQRLVLAHAVSVILGVSVGPLSEAGQLASFVLSCMRAEEHGGAMKEEDSSHALVLANSLSEEEWRSLVKFSNRRGCDRRLFGSCTGALPMEGLKSGFRSV